MSRETALQALAERIVNMLLSSDDDDICDATHGNYDAETLRIRIGSKWQGKLSALLLREGPPQDTIARKPADRLNVLLKRIDVWEGRINAESESEELILDIKQCLESILAGLREGQEPPPAPASLPDELRLREVG